MIQPDVTVLRDKEGVARHAILPWDQFQTLMQAAGADGVAVPSKEADAPAQVRKAISEGVHPVRAWRDHRHLNQAQLAAVVGISRAYLAQIEGRERTGTLDVTARIARALGCLIEQVAPVEDFGAMVATLAAMPSKVRDIVMLIPREAWTHRSASGGFSLLEHVCHLRDIDADGYSLRVERMLTEEQPNLPDIDGDVLATQRDYQSQNLEEALSSFTATRWQTVARLAKLTPDERGRTGLMDAAKEITIEELAGTMLAHDSAHMDELADLCRELQPSART